MPSPQVLYPYALPSQTFAAGGRTTQTLRDLPKVYLGKLAHLAGFIFSFVLTPTWSTSGPDVVGMNNFFTACDFYDGSFFRFQGGLNQLRAQDRIQLGHLRIADAVTSTASASARYYKRAMHVGPAQFSNFPSDFLIANGLLENAELRFSHGSLTNLAGGSGGTVSAATGTCRVTAQLALQDEVRIPPAYQYVNTTVTGIDQQLPGRAVYESIALVTDTTFAAFTAGQVGNVRVDMGNGDIIPAISSRDLSAAFADQHGAGEIGVPQGDPEGTADTNNVQVNRGSPTALTTPANDLQPVLWTPFDGKLSKCPLAESSARFRTDGTLTSALALIGRVLSQPQTVVATNVGKALGRLNIQPKGAKIKSQDKVAYKGNYAEFMPIAVKV